MKKSKKPVILLRDVAELSPYLAECLNMRPRRPLGGKSRQQAYELGLEDAFEVARIREAKDCEAREAAQVAERRRLCMGEEALREQIRRLYALLEKALQRGPDRE